jgi:hypothetical protein
LQVIIVILLEVDPSPHEFIEATVINPAIIILNSVWAATHVEAIINNLDFVRFREGCDSFEIRLGSLFFDSCLSEGF